MNDILQTQIILTRGVADSPDVTEITLRACQEFYKQPLISTNGDNDRQFYSFNFKGQTYFVVFDDAYTPETHETEHSKPPTYTIMLASEY